MNEKILKPLYSIVIPVYNEVESVEELYGEIINAMVPLEKPFEIIFIDDGSRDNTIVNLNKLREKDPRVVLIKFARNYGKSAAYSAGFDKAMGKIIVTLDGDLQDDPNEIPKLLERLNEGNDMVIGWKAGRLENEPIKAIPSKFFNGLIFLLFGLKLRDSNCGFRVMKKVVCDYLDLHGDLYRFIPELAHVKGFKVVEMPVKHRKRKFGYSKYGAKRFWTGLLDLLTVRFITKFSERPLHFFGTLSLLPISIGFSLEIYVLVCKLSGSSFQTHVAALSIGVACILIGFQGITIGLIGEMITARRRRKFLISDDYDTTVSRD